MGPLIFIATNRSKPGRFDGERAPIVLADTEAYGELGSPDKRAGKLDLLRTPDQVIT